MLLLDVQKGTCGAAMQVDASRFRPNLVVSGGRPYDEDGWRDIRIGNKYFRVSSNNLLNIWQNNFFFAILQFYMDTIVVRWPFWLTFTWTLLFVSKWHNLEWIHGCFSSLPLQLHNLLVAFSAHVAIFKTNVISMWICAYQNIFFCLFLFFMKGAQWQTLTTIL